jgi:putative peptidoglycan lipid II flippase
MIGLAVGTVLISSVSKALTDGNMRSVYLQQNSSMRRSMMLIMPCVVGLFVLAEPIIRILFQHGAWTAESTNAVALAIKIQCLVLPAMLISQIYSKTLYAAQDVNTPVRTSIVSLAVATVIYLVLFPMLGYLSIPVGVVVSGYVKNYLLRRACKQRNLVKADKKTTLAIFTFASVSIALGALLSAVSIPNILVLGAAICAFGILYLPVAFIIDRFIIK